MQCPSDGAVLVMSERSGIEIDYCPTCRGVWLDRGEIDKIIERSTAPAAQTPPPAPAPAAAPRSAAPTYQPYGDANGGYPDQRGYDQPLHPGYRGGYDSPPSPPYPDSRPGRGRRRESWLSDLFD